MKGTDTKSVLTIELDTQEALSKISEMRVDLELPEEHNVPQANVKTPVTEDKLTEDNVSEEKVIQEKVGQAKVTQGKVTQANQRNMYTGSVRPGCGSVRKATVRVNSVQAHVTNSSSF